MIGPLHSVVDAPDPLALAGCDAAVLGHPFGHPFGLVWDA